MRRPLVVLGTFLCTLVLAVVWTAPAATAAPGGDPPTAARWAATWLAHQVNDQGFVPQAADKSQPNLSVSAQTVLALASAGVGRAQVDALLGYLGAHVDDFVASGGNDDPGSLAFLILGAVAGGQDPTNFGSSHSDLVTRLQATKQASGLFGASDPTFDGAFRQGLALMALTAAGASDASAQDWLAAQQCADGLWTAFRADTTQPCPAVDPATFSGPDTNSTALAILGLHAQGRSAPAASGASALQGVRNANGGWGYLARSDQPTDANSTGLVVSALQAATGTQDAQGVSAIRALQADCNGDPADAGGIAFQDLSSGPDALATAQATPALAGVALPLGRATITDELQSCPVAVPSPPLEAAPTPAEGPVTAGEPLARTGAPVVGEAGGALLLVGAGIVLVTLSQLAETRRRRSA